MEYKIRLGVVGTRRNIFSREDAIKYNDIILDKLKSMNIDIIDIKEKYNGEINILKDSITLLRFRYERKKTEIVR